MTAEIDLPLVVHGKPLTLNQRHHHKAKARLVAEIRRAAGWATKALKLGHHDHVSVQLHYRPGDARRRDPENLVATQKPAIDGLVDAGLIDDDDPLHLTWWAPAIHPEPGKRRLWLAIHLPEESK